MYAMVVALAREMKVFPGGPKALAQSVMAGAEALRPMRWPAERLDTLGGYVTYHNITLFAIFLSIYGCVLGSRVIRGDEEKHSLEEVLSSGRSRFSVIRDRTMGSFTSIAIISAGLGLGTAASMSVGKQPDISGSMISFATVGLCAMAAFCLGLLVSQFVSSTSVAAGLSSLFLTILYVSTNVWEKIGFLGIIHFISPFHYANASRALVPGYGLDISSTLALLLMSAILFALAALVFEHRDYESTLMRTSIHDVPQDRVRVQRKMLNSIWSSILLRGKIGLISWSLSAGAFSALMTYLWPSVKKAWSAFDFLFAVAGSGATSQDQYFAFAGEITYPVVAAFVITQASRWVSDLTQGRVEMILASPISWSRLVWQRMLALCVGVTIISIVSVVGLGFGAASAGVHLHGGGLLRLVISETLVGIALGSIACIAVALMANNLVVITMALFVGASYLLSVLIPMLGWPQWLYRISIFTSLGHPYIEWPSIAGFALLLAFALPGGLIATQIAERSTKVA